MHVIGFYYNWELSKFIPPVVSSIMRFYLVKLPAYRNPHIGLYCAGTYCAISLD